ncbi:serine protease [Gammaproteobacteria bacterium]|nr:serine protease [Gammaproteobacteria bacterium]
MKILLFLVICLLIIYPSITSKTQTFGKSIVILQSEYLGGTGFCIKYKGGNAILTAAHVVKGVDHTCIITSDGDTIQGVVLRRDTIKDLALIVAGGLDDLKPLKVSTKNMKTGDKVVTVGHPAGYMFSYLEGIIANAYRYDEVDELGFLQLQMSVYPGISGSPALHKGKIVGILLTYDPNFATCFAIKSEHIKDFLDD